MLRCFSESALETIPPIHPFCLRLITAADRWQFSLNIWYRCEIQHILNYNTLTGILTVYSRGMQNLNLLRTVPAHSKQPWE